MTFYTWFVVDHGSARLTASLQELRRQYWCLVHAFSFPRCFFVTVSIYFALLQCHNCHICVLYMVTVWSHLHSVGLLPHSLAMLKRWQCVLPYDVTLSLFKWVLYLPLLHHSCELIKVDLQKARKIKDARTIVTYCFSSVGECCVWGLEPLLGDLCPYWGDFFKLSGHNLVHNVSNWNRK